MLTKEQAKRNDDLMLVFVASFKQFSLVVGMASRCCSQHTLWFFEDTLMIHRLISTSSIMMETGFITFEEFETAINKLILDMDELVRGVLEDAQSSKGSQPTHPPGLRPTQGQAKA